MVVHCFKTTVAEEAEALCNVTKFPFGIKVTLQSTRKMFSDRRGRQCNLFLHMCHLFNGSQGISE